MFDRSWPPGAQPPGQQNKTPIYIAIGAVVAVALVALIVVLSGGDDDEPASEPTGSTNTTEATPPTTSGGPDEPGPTTTESDDPDEPSGSSEIAVVDEGFSNFMGGYDQDERTASYGFIVENTGDDTVTDISISVSVFDANGTALASASHTIYVLRPGQKLGIGDEFYGENFATEVAELQVQLSEPSDYGVGDVPDEGELTATSFQIYADSDAVLRHWKLSDPYIAEVMKHCTVAAFEVFGNPSEEVRAGFGSMDDMAVTIHPRLVGYLKAGASR